MTNPLLAMRFTEPVLLLEGLGFVTVALGTAAHVKARYQATAGKTGKPREPESRPARLALLGFPLLGLLTACVLTNERRIDPIEVAEIFSLCLFWGILAGLMSGVVLQTAAISRAREGIWDRELDGWAPDRTGNRSRERASQGPRGDRDDGSSPGGGIAVLSGSHLTAWSTLPLVERSHTEYELRLMPDSPVVVGRFHGGLPPYLDPAYRPTTIVPGTGQRVLHSGGRGTDRYVSRAHFMLRAVPGGILFVNGVPRRGGGIRPPLYRTRLISPEARDLNPGEEYLIRSGTAMVVRLPNGSEIRIGAG